MAVTPNYSWPVPDDTDLVKDGAEAIRDLGNAIDTTVDGLPSGGLVHINSTSFSAVASQSINDVFSATYKNYRIVVNFVCSTNSLLSIRLRVGGVDNSATNTYILQSAQFSTGSSFIARTTANQWSGFDAPDIRHGISFDLFNPFQALVTTGSSANLYFDGASIANQIQGLYHTVASSFDGISFFPNAGNITGTISIYGYKE